MLEVNVSGEFGAAGEPARNLRYRAKITAEASEAAIQTLAEAPDAVAEIQNTLRQGMAVTFDGVEPVSIEG